MSNKNQEPSCFQGLLYGATNLFLFIAGSANLLAGTIAAFNSSPAIAATSLTAALVLLFAATIDRFESLKGLGVEAKTRQLDQKLIQANEAMNKLREMTELTGANLVGLKCGVGRLDTAPGPEELIEFAEKIRSMMKSLGSSDYAINEALTPWAFIMSFDMARVKIEPLRQELRNREKIIRDKLSATISQINPDINTELNQQLIEIGKFIKRTNDLYKLEMNDFPEKFMAYFDNVPGLTLAEVQPFKDSAAEIIQDMSSLKKNRVLINPDKWIELISEFRKA